MPAIEKAAAAFLANRRVAVTGVSRQPSGHAGNVVYQPLRERGYEAFAVNPHAGEVEDDRWYPDLRSIPGSVEAVVIATRPEAAAVYGRRRGIAVIDGGCPCMFDPTADFGHKLIRFACTLTGNVPRKV